MATEVDYSQLTEEEEAALKSPPETNTDEEGTTPPEEEKVEKEETAAPETGETKVETTPEAKVEVTPQIDGIIAKDGKNFIPFAVLEQERAKRQALEAELVEARKPRVEPQPQAQTKTQEYPAGIDFKAMAKQLYSSEEDAAVVLQNIFDAGIQAAQTAGSNVSDARTFEHLWGIETNTIRAENPWLTPLYEGVVQLVVNDSLAKNPIVPGDLRGLAQRTREVVSGVKKELRIGEKPFDVEGERKKIRTEVTNELMQKFNISKPKVTTLAGVRNVNPDVSSKFERIDQLSGIDLEEAIGLLTSSERDAYLRRTA